jgi:hypothetical protein
MAEQRTQKAIRECGEWLVACLRMGWGKDSLDALEALWWEHHDERGNLKPAAGLSGTSVSASDEAQP